MTGAKNRLVRLHIIQIIHMQLGCVETMDREIRIIVAGYREFNDYEFVKKEIHKLLFKLIDLRMVEEK